MNHCTHKHKPGDDTLYADGRCRLCREELNMIRKFAGWMTRKKAMAPAKHGDLAERVLQLRLEAECAPPWERERLIAEAERVAKEIR